jgi:hypothetical protein
MLTFELTEQEASLIVQALADLPYKLTVGLIAKLQEQAKPQLAKGAE